jgi:hypothetical protein
LSDEDFWSISPRQLGALTTRWLESRHLADALSAKAPYAVAAALGEAKFEDFLILTERQEPKPAEAFSQLASALKAIAPHGNK